MKTSDRIALVGIIIAVITAIATFGQWLSPREPRTLGPEVLISPTATSYPHVSVMDTTNEHTLSSTSLSSMNGSLVYSAGPYGGSAAPFQPDNMFEIYTMNIDGSDKTRLTNRQVRSRDPVWSPDGRRIAFSSGETTGYDIYIMNDDGSNLTRLTKTSSITWSPSWSPDGRYIAFESNYDIYIIELESLNIIQLTNSEPFDRYTDWSPDGRHIVFSSAQDSDNLEIYTIGVDGSGLTRLTFNAVNHHNPRWSPDGKRIIFDSHIDADSPEIYVVNADGSNLTRLTNNQFYDWEPAWSPDGNFIIFSSTRGGSFDIYAMQSDGTQQTSLSSEIGMTNFDPSWVYK